MKVELNRNSSRERYSASFECMSGGREGLTYELRRLENVLGKCGDHTFECDRIWFERGEGGIW